MANNVDPDQTAPFWVHAVCFYSQSVSYVRQLFAADDFSRRHLAPHHMRATCNTDGSG